MSEKEILQPGHGFGQPALTLGITEAEIRLSAGTESRARRQADPAVRHQSFAESEGIAHLGDL